MKHRSAFQRAAAAPHIVWAVLFILAPMLFVLYFAFTDADGSFSPSRPLTRAEAAGCLYRASQAMADSGRDFWDIF